MGKRIEVSYVVLLLYSWFTKGYGISCYTCHNINSDHNATGEPCGDPFSSSHVTYTVDCMQGIKARSGEFPAHFCIKMDGYSVTDGTRLFVRTCSITSMGHQCGEFKFGEPAVRYRGCVSSCDQDACNTAGISSKYTSFHMLIVSLTVTVMKWIC